MISKNPLVSVLMSVYNESLDQVSLSLDSMLNQTFSDFEIIVIIDNPMVTDYQLLLDSYKQKDERIKWFVNEENIGLALSMNKAFEASSGKYIARMDADDLSLPERLSKEIDVLSSGYDCVFSNYDLIDDNDAFISRDPSISVFNNISLEQQIANRSIIHHPTVMFSRDVFLRAGKYRNYPCSQDLDLWLRMIDVGCSFFFIDEVLLHYRVRQTSVSGKNRLKQHLTIDFIRKCFLERIRTGSDSYSYEKYSQYISKRTSERKMTHYNKMSSLLYDAKAKNKNGKKLFAIIERLFVFLLSSVHRRTHIFNRKITKGIATKYGK